MPLLLIEVQEFFHFGRLFCFVLVLFILVCVFFSSLVVKKATLQFQTQARLFKVHFAVQVWWKSTWTLVKMLSIQCFCRGCKSSMQKNFAAAFDAPKE